jgi:phosphoribosylanthranilate isomerase/indole-3-glycerol phosphate synthase/phosphoribosylanthranilate isomerase
MEKYQMPENSQSLPTLLRQPQIKVCGLTRVRDAMICLDAGVDAIGLVFYPPSPRHVERDHAARITAAVDGRAISVGVFVDETYDRIMQMAEHCALRAVQLHGQESPELIGRLKGNHLTVIKALFHSRAPYFKEADAYDASSFLLECGRGKLPGGNAETWQWQSARSIARRKPIILAGGLTPENVTTAIRRGLPDAVDVSSGVESAPGRKQSTRIKAFIEAVTQSDNQRSTRRIF